MRGSELTDIVAQEKLITEPVTKINEGKVKKENDPGAPKRPPTAFFLFVDEFRKDFKENFPDNNSAAAVAKEGGAKWKAMSDSEKAPYVEKAASKKGEYGISLKLHKHNAEAKEKSASTSKSSSEVHDDVEEVASPQHFVKGGELYQNRVLGRFRFSPGKMGRGFSFKHNVEVHDDVEEVHNDVEEVGRLSSSLKSRRSFGLSIWKMARSFCLNYNSSCPSVQDPSTAYARKSLSFRRILEPLLKLKGSQEKIQKSNLDPSPISATSVNNNESLQSKKKRPSNVLALVQLTLKNGIPFFELVVKSSSDILVADIIQLPSEDDSSLIYAFYVVHESEKKSSGVGCDIVGEMKISSSYVAEYRGPEKALYVVRESVFNTTDTADCTLNGRLAVIIVKNLCDKTCRDIGSSKSTVVILPEGVHSWPNSVPSIINRWKSGGKCDYGRLDIGCHFHVLSNQDDENIQTTSSSMLCATSDRLELCYEVGNQNKCSFRLVSFENGQHSMEYDTSMSLLQAFSIAVAVITSHKLTGVLDL